MSPRLERLHSLINRGLPLAPVHSAFEVRLTEATAGRCTARMPAEPLDRQPDPRGAGPLLVLADAVLGVSISSTLPEDRGVTTLRMGIRTLASWWPSDGWVTATARADDVDDETGTSHGQLTDDDGRVLATFDTRCAVIASPEDWLRSRPVEAARGINPGDEAAALTVELHPGERETTLSAITGPGAGNARGAVQGGVLAILAERLLVTLLDGRESGEPGPLRHDLEVHYLRAALGGRLSGHAESVHSGRRLRTARAVVLNDTGRQVITASGLSYSGGDQ